MKGIYLCCIIWLVFIFRTSQLRLHSRIDRGNILSSLNDQQDSLNQNTNKLIQMIDETNSNVDAKNDILQKISILQSAIINQENQVNLLSRNLVPTIQFSPTYCSTLTDDDKEQLKQLSSNTIQKLNKLTETLNNMDPKDLRVIQMKQDAQNQIFYLENVNSLLDNSCESQTILSPTVFQSNIYAPNWLLGNQTMDQFISTYIGRSINYQNITNCPVQFPFFNGKKCINCYDSTPLFNMKTLVCEACKELEQFDQTIKKCINSTIYLNNIFTNKPWATNTGNLTQVLQSNIQFYESNSTNMSGRYQYCKQDQPFLIQGQCSTCPNDKVFVFQSSKCQKVPTDKIYDPNTHSFVEEVIYFETNPNAPNVITTIPLQDSPAKPNCPMQLPFYDDIACIKCPFPFDLFDNQRKICVSCNPQQFYNSGNKSCQKRPIVYQANKESINLLIGTPNFKVQDFMFNATKASQDKNAIVSKCSPNQISNISNCVQCSGGQYFNVASKKCIVCQKIDLKANICWDNVVFKPADSQIDKLIGTNPGDVTDFVSNLNDVDSVDSVVCNQTAPFSNGTKCMSCATQKPLFNVITNQCTQCKQYLNLDTHVCQEKITYFLPNPSVKGNYTGSNASSIDLYLKSFETNTNGKIQYKNCQQKTPYSNFKQCLKCEMPTFIFNVTSLTCVECPENAGYDKKTSTCIKCQVGFLFNTTKGSCSPICEKNTVYNSSTKECDKKIYLSVAEDNFVGQSTKQVQKYFANQTNLLNNSPLAVQCNSSAPYSTGYGCIFCKDPNKLFNITSKQCTSCPNNQFYNSTIFVCVQCPKDSVYDNKSETCIVCQVGLKYNTTKRSCMPICLNDYLYNSTTKECDKKIYLSVAEDNFVGQSTKQVQKYFVNQTNLLNNSPLAVQCNSSFPYSTGYGCVFCKDPNKLFNITSKQCTSCPNNQYYNAESYTCNSCLEQELYNSLTLKCQLRCKNKDTKWNGTYCASNCTAKQFFNNSLQACQNYSKYTFQKVSNLKIDNWVSQDPDTTLSQIKQMLQNNATSCPQNLPFFDGKNCIDCPKNEVFFMDAKGCKSCPSESYFNVFSHECRGKQDFITNIDSKNLIFDGFSYGELSYYYNQNKTTYPDIKDCIDPTPYFAGKKCQSCPEQTPYFNIVYRMCVNCPDGSTYDQIKRECLNEVGQIVEQNPSLSKLVASIFTHKNNLSHKKLHRLDSSL